MMRHLMLSILLPFLGNSQLQPKQRLALETIRERIGEESVRG